jgi:polyketide synthase 12
MSLLLNRIHELGEQVPEATAVAFLDDRGSVAESMTRADVVRVMGEMAAYLRLHCGLAPGDRALLVYPPGLDFVRALVGCLAAGIVPVPVFPPDPFNAHTSMQGFANIAADCAATAVLTSREYAAMRELGAAKASMNSPAVQWPTHLSWHVTSLEAIGPAWREVDWAPTPADELWVPTPDTPALLQYTSGSTSTPKGVVITFGNLAHQLDFNRRHLGLGLDSRGVFWVPAYHDFGLISGILSTLAGNFELTLMSPLSFIARPALWFEVMDRVRATHTVSPNFGYELAVRKTTAEQRAGWDLSSLTMVMSAAEPVRADTTQRFLDAFAVSGLRPEAFCPSYGLAEHTVGVTVFGRSQLRVDSRVLQTQQRAVDAQGADTEVFVGCGQVCDDIDVRIVDPERRVQVDQGQVGEIWVDSPSKAAGYWGRPEISEATFNARLAENPGGPGYLRTGDLGFLRDGELYICGRLKDLIILAGRNIHPHDIEDSLRGCHDAIRPGGIAAFAIDDHDSEALAVLLEVPADTPAAVLTEVVAAVRTTVLTCHQLTCTTVAVGPPGTVSKTTSGKLQRARCRTRLTDGSLDAEALLIDRLQQTEPADHAPAQAPQDGHGSAAGQLDAPITGGHRNGASELLAAVREQAGAVLGIGAAGVDLDQPLGAQGLNSLGVVKLASRLSRVIGREVHSADVFNHPTVRRLAQFFSEGDQQRHHQRPPAQVGRYAVIGAGAAGIAAASALIEQGAAEVVVFEAGNRVGGKVYSYTDAQGRVAELGQAALSWKCQRTLGMAARLGLDTIPFDGLSELQSGGSYRELDNGAEALKATAWSRQVLAAAGIHSPITLTDLRNRSDLGVGIGTWCRLHGLPAAPLMWRHWWTGYGYGPLDDDTTPAAYLVAIGSLCDGVVDGTPTNLVGQLRVKGGNDQLWALELQRLQSTGQLHWRPSCPVHALRPSDGAVVVQTQDGQQDSFDRVVVACPPRQARSLLPDGDQRGALLDRFHTTDYITTVFTATGLQLPGGYGVLADTELSMDGRPLQLMVLDSDLFIVWQYGVEGTEAASIDTIAELITALGGQFGHVVRRQHWPFFPRLTPADWEAGVLDALERAQGRDGIVLVGSYLGFETVEHVVAHAQDTVARYCTAPIAEVDEPVAIVAMACRAPGGVADPDQFWALLDEGRDGIAAFPKRWNTEELYDPDPDAAGKTYAREGGFLDEVESFDAEFFDISPREATAMDPQQRVVLEVAWEALERAGLPIADLDGSDTGVYLGCQNSDYDLGTLTLEALDGHRITGSTSSVLSGRIAYVLGLQGPAITIDTACSSSLVAVHLAASALRRHECTLALAGGVQVMSTPATFVEFSRLRALAPDGRCKAFSADADGTGWAEGCGIVVLKRLSDAHRDGDRVLAVIRGSAINQDGRSHGLTAPNGLSQQRVIRQALHRSGLTPADIDAIEAHGTGTTLGDPIEASALAEVFGPTRDPHRPLWLGTAKSNIGHTQAAAGVLGVIKMVLALNHEHLPKTLHAHTPSPHIPWQTSGLALLQQPQAWPADPQRPRRAGISSFGFSGTNAHLILEQPPTPTPPTPASSPTPPPLVRVWPISARTPAALAGQADRLRQYVLAHPDVDLTDVAYSLATTRTHHPHRAVITVPSDSEDPRQHVIEVLDALARHHPHHGLAQHHHHPGGSSSRTVFVLPGHGSQYPGMATGLYASHPVFAAALNECDRVLRPLTGSSVVEVIGQGPDALSWQRVEVIQPVLFAVMVSLAATMRGYGIAPDAVIGHSQGEVAAAYIAGALSLEDAAKVVAVRSQALSTVCGAGAMVSVLRGVEELGPWLEPYGAALSIAAVNSPTHVGISGETNAIAQFSAACERDGIQVRRVAGDLAFHSAQVEPLRDRLLGALAGLAPRPGRVPLYSTVASTVSGDPLDTTTMDADYWYANLREQVDFYSCVSHLLAEGECVFVELSSHPVLAPAVSDTLAAVSGWSGSVVIPTLHRQRADLDGLATALGRLHLYGRSPRWESVYPGAGAVELPTYPFVHHRFWLAPTSPANAASLGLGRVEHPLLGAVTEVADEDQILVSGRLSLAQHGWLAGHVVLGHVVFPAAGFVEILLCAGELAGCPVVDEVVLQAPLVLAADAPTDVQVRIQPAHVTGRRVFSVHARPGHTYRDGSGWVLHATGTLSAEQPAGVTPTPSAPLAVDAIDVDRFYDRLATRGLAYRGLFRGLRGLGSDPTRPETVCAEVELPASSVVSGYGIHPALLDAALHPLVTAFDDITEADSGLPRLPFAVSGITLYATAATRLRVHLTPVSADSFRLQATDPAGTPVLGIKAITLRELPATLTAGAPPTGIGLGGSLLELAWSPQLTPTPLSPPPAAAARWVVITRDPEQLPASLGDHPTYSDLDHPDLAAAQLVIWALLPTPDSPDTPDTCDIGPSADPAARVHALTGQVLMGLQTWLTRPGTRDTVLVALTRHAVTIGVEDRVPDLAQAAVWALVHTAANEHPGRIGLIDIDDTAATSDTLITVLMTPSGPTHWAGEPQLALRHGIPYLPRLTRSQALTPPPQTSCWQLATTAPGELTRLALLPTEPARVLGPGQIRVQIRAAGLNFRDVDVALGTISGDGLGGEAAGIVVQTAADVTTVRRGDAVLGLFPYNAFAPTAITEADTVIAKPQGWSFIQAASVPAAFLTAYLALVEVGGLRAGQRVLIHAGAGGVGHAAIQISTQLGAQVYATAHPSEHHLLDKLGVPRARIASSPTPDSGTALGLTIGGHGVDVVLNSPGGDLIETSLKLIGAGGRFVQIGGSDLGEAQQIEAAHPGVGYLTCDPARATPDQLHRAWTALSELFTAGVLAPLPTTRYSLTHAVSAFSDLRQGRHTGKIVLTPPAVFDPTTTVLITGGTGMLGGLFAEHLITRHGVRHLLLVSRRGPNADGAQQLQNRLSGLGAHVRISACDTSNPAALSALLDSIPTHHRLGAIIHTAAVLADAVITKMTATQLDAVLAAKADTACHLYQLTKAMDLDAFIVFSSAAGIMGAPGQANYAAANAVLDALAHHHHNATSLAWGYWHTPSAITSHLGGGDQARLVGAGFIPISTEQGLALFDAALTCQQPLLIPAPLNTATLARLAHRNSLPAVLSRLTTTRPHAATTSSAQTLTTQLAGQTPPQRQAALTSLVIRATAAVLAHQDPKAIDPDQQFRDLGTDSLAALELRNTLATQTGLTLPATLVFDYPSPAAVVAYLVDLLGESGGGEYHASHNLSVALPEPAESVSEASGSGVAYDSLGLIVKEGFRAGEIYEALNLLKAAAKLRSTLQSHSGIASPIVPSPTTLTAGPSLPHLILICTSVPNSGVHKYLRFASEFKGVRPVSAIPLPGFLQGEAVPPSPEAALELLTQAVTTLAGDEPFVLAGYSSGGRFAYALAKHFEDIQNANLSGVALLDTFLSEAIGDSLFRDFARHITDDLPGEAYMYKGANLVTKFTAAVTWTEFSRDLYSGPLETDVLFLHCTKPWGLPSESGELEYFLAEPWDTSQTVGKVPVDHASMIDDGSATAAQILEEWIGRNQIPESRHRDTATAE